jgi:hypothetical protein
LGYYFGKGFGVILDKAASGGIAFDAF